MNRLVGRFPLRRSLFFLVGTLALAVGALLIWPAGAFATHSWGGYHWARISTSSPFTLTLGDNVSITWDGHLVTAAADWDDGSEFFYITDPDSGATSTYPDMLNLRVVPGTGGTSCKSSSGTVQVCNRKYGFNGWLGIAQIWVNGDHITKGVAKMNDSYFNRYPYDNPVLRQFVMCQEIGHTFGLDHQPSSIQNSCMASTAATTSNQGPNAHDFEQLALIYGSHADGFTTVASIPASGGAPASAFGRDSDEWGRAVGADGIGRPNVFVKNENGGKKITWVYWADGE